MSQLRPTAVADDAHQSDRQLGLTASQNVHFREQAGSWDDRYRDSPSFRARLNAVRGAIEAALASAPGGRVLDFGGGTGIFSTIAAEWAAFTVCIDRSEAMLVNGRTSTPMTGAVTGPIVPESLAAIHRVAGDERCLWDSMTPFDLVLAIAVVEYVANVDELLVSFGRLVGQNGLILMSVPNPRSNFRRAERLIGGVVAILPHRRGSGRLVDLSYLGLRPHGDNVPWQRAAAKAGLIVDRITAVPLGPTGLRTLFRPTLLVSLRRSR